MSKISSTEKKRRFILLSILITILSAVLVFIAFALFAPEPKPSDSNMKAANSRYVKGQAGGQGTAAYNEKVIEHDSKQADLALKAGESFLPTPLGQKPSVVQKKEVKQEQTPPPPPVVVAPVRPAAPLTNTNTKRNAELLKSMKKDLASLDAKLASASLSNSKIIFVQDEQTTLSPAKDAQKPLPLPTPSPFKAGDLLYGVVETSVNSDVPSVVMATLVSGKHKNTRLIGSFQSFEEKLVLAFSRAILANGQEISLEGYAIDPATSESSVASSVDTHFFSRWGGLIASSFLAGLGNATQMSGAESTNYGYTGGVASNNILFNTYSLGEQALIAAGNVGSKASEIFEKNFERPPTVYLDAGTAIGVLIVTTKGK